MSTVKGSNLAFTALGLLFVSVGVILQVSKDGVSGLVDILPDIAINVGVTVLAVSLVAAIWRQLGDDPIQRSIDPLQRSIDKLQGLIELFSDSRKTGVVRLYEHRDAYEKEKLERLRERMRHAKRIDLMGRVLYRDWASVSRSRSILREAIEAGCEVRVLVFDPEGSAARRRDREEAKSNGLLLAEGETGRVVSNIRDTVSIFRKFVAALPDEKKSALEVGLIADAEIYSQIVRVDDYIWVQHYLYHSTGGDSSSMEIEGPNSPLFTKYCSEFESMWGISDRGSSANITTTPA